LHAPEARLSMSIVAHPVIDATQNNGLIQDSPLVSDLKAAWALAIKNR